MYIPFPYFLTEPTYTRSNKWHSNVPLNNFMTNLLFWLWTWEEKGGAEFFSARVPVCSCVSVQKERETLALINYSAAVCVEELGVFLAVGMATECGLLSWHVCSRSESLHESLKNYASALACSSKMLLSGPWFLLYRFKMLLQSSSVLPCSSRMVCYGSRMLLHRFRKLSCSSSMLLSSSGMLVHSSRMVSFSSVEHFPNVVVHF